jgi:transposase-like protein
MMPVELSHPAYHDDDEARKCLEAIRWPDGVTCPHCSAKEGVRPLKEGGRKSSQKKPMGDGWYYCEKCQDKFTVRVGTVYERSHIKLHKWLLGFRMMAASKKGFSAHQLSRTLNITYKSAWFMAHRIREAMGETNPPPLGGKDKVVEVDETFIGQPDYIFVNGKGWQQVRGVSTKRKVISLVERGGKARSFKVENFKPDTIRKVLFENISTESRLHTDEAHHYRKPGREFAAHERVIHCQEEYARGDVTTNTVEGFFSIFKRGMTGVYQHCSEQHLSRYLKEFDFRYSNRSALGVEDVERTTRAIKGAAGKRLTYRNPDGKAAA